MLYTLTPPEVTTLLLVRLFPAVTRKETTVFDQDEYIKDNVQLEK